MHDVSTLLGHSSVRTTEQYYADWNTARRNRLARIVRGAHRKDSLTQKWPRAVTSAKPIRSYSWGSQQLASTRGPVLESSTQRDGQPRCLRHREGPAMGGGGHHLFAPDSSSRRHQDLPDCRGTAMLLLGPCHELCLWAYQPNRSLRNAGMNGMATVMASSITNMPGMTTEMISTSTA